ncbi:Hypothetical predicted protein [Octopus vulgaris]|uniref:Uncharacterized protein n=1 Tax=Octopus vulgaris TaxID=6645 RepID=A0AA36EZ07_OCTVU|nr:Hypothetical predicted protein [Octopus vulgaris]
MEDLIRSIPHINVGNIQMANWQDVKITLFPDCSESNCTIVLNSLKFTLKYPLQRKNIHKCSSSERAKFLENFQIVDTGIIIVNLEDVWKNRQNLNKLVRWKHVISKDASSLNCRASQLVSNIDNVLNSSFLPSCDSIAKLPNQIIWSVPHISVQGNPMASWSDIRDVLFPGCTGKNCAIVLNCLRLKLKTTSVNNGAKAGGTPFKNWLHLTKKTITSCRSNKPNRNQLNDVNVSGNKTNDKTSQTVPLSRTKTCIVATDKKNAGTRPEKLNFNHKKQLPHYLPKEKNTNPQIYSSTPTSGKKSGLTLNARSHQEKLHSKENNDSVNFLAKRKTAEKSTVPTSSSGKTSTRRVLQTYGHSERKCKVPIQNSKKLSKQKKRTMIMKNGTSLKYKKELQRNCKGMLNITNNSRSRFNNKENIREVSSDVGENYPSKVNQGFINVDWKSIYPVHGSLIKAKPIKKNILMRELLKKDIDLLRETAKLVCTCRDAYRPADKAPLCRFLQQKFNTNSSHCLVHSLIVGEKPQRKTRNSDPKLESTSLEPKDNANDNKLTSTKEKLFFVRHPKKVMLDAYHRQKPEVE